MKREYEIHVHVHGLEGFSPAAQFDQILKALAAIHHQGENLMATLKQAITDSMAADVTLLATINTAITLLKTGSSGDGLSAAEAQALADQLETGVATKSAANTALHDASGTTAPGNPSVTSVSPLSGPAGTAVTISGSGFGATQGSSTVLFNGADSGPASQWSDASISTTVPAGASTGDVVVNTAGGRSAPGETFTVA